MSKNKKKKVLIGIFLIITLIFINTIIKKEKRELMLNEMPIIREYLFDLISLSKIDINNYSIDANFNDKKSAINPTDMWNKSMSKKYMNENLIDNIKSKTGKTMISDISQIIKEIHILNIEFLKDNPIPVESLEGDNSDIALNSFIEKVEINEQKLKRDTAVLSSKIKGSIQNYIQTLTKNNISVNYEKETELYRNYFNEEYSEFLDKQFDVKMNDALSN